jgi:hypothetical protein
VYLPVTANIQADARVGATSASDALPRVNSANNRSAATATAGGFGRTGQVRLLSDQTTAVASAVVAAHQRRSGANPAAPVVAAGGVVSSSATSNNDSNKQSVSRPTSGKSVTDDWVIVDSPIVEPVPPVITNPIITTASTPSITSSLPAPSTAANFVMPSSNAGMDLSFDLMAKKKLGVSSLANPSPFTPSTQI